MITTGALAADLPLATPEKNDASWRDTASFFQLNDNALSFTWFPNATAPGVPGGSAAVTGGVPGQSNAFNKFAGTITHFDAWAYGTNFFDLDLLQSDRNNPVGGIEGDRGSTEIYGFMRNTLSFNALFGGNRFSSAVLKDVSFEWGGDVSSEDDQFHYEKRAVTFGLQFGINLPGTVNLAILAYKEWNHNAFLGACSTPGPSGIVGLPQSTCAAGSAMDYSGDREFNWVPRIELLMSEPLRFLPWSVTWSSFTGVTFPKGTGVSTENLLNPNIVAANGGIAATIANYDTKTEIFEDNRLTLDASQLLGARKGIFDLYFGYRYWYNKFGNNHNAPLFAAIAPGSAIESTTYLGATYHFR